MPGLLNPNFTNAYNTAYQAGPNAQNTMANTNLVNQQTTAAQLENQQTQMVMPMLQQAIQRYQQSQQQQQAQGQASGAQAPGNSNNGNEFGVAQDVQPQGTTTQGAPTVAPTAASSLQDSGAILKQLNDHVDGKLANQFTPVQTAMDPQHATDYAQLQAIAGFVPKARGMMDSFKQQWDSQQSGINQQKQLGADHLYTSAYQVATASQRGQSARSVLEQVDPQDAKALPATMTDADIERWASHVTASSFKYTGRPVETDKDGYLRDGSNHSIIPGLQGQRVTLSPEQTQQIRTTMLDVHPWTNALGQTEQLPQWEILNEEAKKGGRPPLYTSGEDAVQKSITAADQAKTQAQQDPYAESKAQATDIVARARARAATQPPQNVQQSPPISGGTPPPATAQGMAAPAMGTPPAHPVSSTPSSGPLKYNPSQPSIDVSQLPKEFTNSHPYAIENDPGRIAQATQLEQQRPILQTQANQKASNANDGINLDKQLLMLIPTAQFGVGTGEMSRVQNFLQSFKSDPDKANAFVQHMNMQDPAAREVVNKWLNQVSTKDLAANIGSEGSSARFSAMLANIGMKNMSANADLTKRAISYMVKWDLASNSYEAQKWGTDRKAAMAPGVKADPISYDTNYGTIKPPQNVIPQTLRAMDQFGNVRMPGAPQNSEGDTIVTKSGKPAQFHNGQWYPMNSPL